MWNKLHVNWKETREKTSVELRVSPCEICNFPLTDVHHILDFKQHGNSMYTWNLCPNCHALLHIAIGSIIFNRKRDTEVWKAFKNSTEDKKLIKDIEDKVYETAELNIEVELKYY